MVELNIASGNHAGTLLRNRQRSLILGVHDNANAFQIEQDIDDVFLDTVERGVFVQHAFDAAIDDGAAAYR